MTGVRAFIRSTQCLTNQLSTLYNSTWLSEIQQVKTVSYTLQIVQKARHIENLRKFYSRSIHQSVDDKTNTHTHIQQ